MALDVLYFSEELRLNRDSREIAELSELLNDLPIVPLCDRGEIFRNSNGIKNQLVRFQLSYPNSKKDAHVGSISYEVADEFEGKRDELHGIACAIRQNREFFKTAAFGSELEGEDFPEGALLFHLHRVLEARDGRRAPSAKSCEVCHIDLHEVYKPVSGGFLQKHLTAPVTELNGSRQYKAGDFITVCPNCHAVLHKYRPWVSGKNAEDILFYLRED